MNNIFALIIWKMFASKLFRAWLLPQLLSIALGTGEIEEVLSLIKSNRHALDHDGIFDISELFRTFESQTHDDNSELLLNIDEVAQTGNYSYNANERHSEFDLDELLQNINQLITDNDPRIKSHEPTLPHMQSEIAEVLRSLKPEVNDVSFLGEDLWLYVTHKNNSMKEVLDVAEAILIQFESCI